MSTRSGVPELDVRGRALVAVPPAAHHQGDKISTSVIESKP